MTNNFSFFKLTAKDKKKYIITQLITFMMIIGAFIIAMNLEKLDLPSSQEKYSASIGFIMLLIVMIIAFANRLKALFKVKFIGFLIIAIAVTLLSKVIDTLALGLWLMLIPLVIDDCIFKVYWKAKWYRDYE